jgi:hypothetical protein
MFFVSEIFEVVSKIYESVVSGKICGKRSSRFVILKDGACDRELEPVVSGNKKDPDRRKI